MVTDDGGPKNDDAKALEAVFRRLLAPLVRLAVSRGLPYAAVDEWLRASFVKAAYQAHPELPAHRRASRVSAATGLHRREVQRLLAHSDVAVPPARSLAAEVFAHWSSHKDYTRADRQPRVLPRTGPAPSFETLAQTITRDVHPRTLLEELLRLELAQRDPRDDTVSLVQDAFVPSKDVARMTGFLGANVGDHLAGAVANVLGDAPGHFDQAVFASDLSEDSVAAVRAMVTAHWKALTDEMVPALEAMLERDESRPDVPALQRVRVGLYSFQEAVAEEARAPGAAEEAPRRRPKARAESIHAAVRAPKRKTGSGATAATRTSAASRKTAASRKNATRGKSP